MIVVTLGWGARIQWRWLTFAGALTYPRYLLHETMGRTALRALHDRDVKPWTAVAVVTGGMLVTAWLVHRLIEKPLTPRVKTGMTRSIDQLRAATYPRGPEGLARGAYCPGGSGMRQVIRKRSDGGWPGRPTGIMLFTR
ncbi:hypothetical protein ABZW03_07955 [Kitasatospora sp. NPDC004799]|uniref:hypothetical protein n=1 Tax=Kitasatospora sp. NPDC004799 TaxID=3154460 RepID=UPI0033BC6555